MLTEEQQKILDGRDGEVIRRQMRLLVRLGEIYGADKMIEISSAQISGVSYKSIGEPGLEFLKDIAGAGVRVRVPSFLNPCGIDLEQWEKLGFPADFAARQKEILTAYHRMGIVMAATCTPYLAGNLPRFREHLAWGESSAVSFANSVIGARTNREGGPAALAAAIMGFTPNYGMHLDENRKPQALIEVDADLAFSSDFGALGYYVGKKIANKIPYFVGIRRATVDNLKSLGAAMAASGSVAMYHVKDMTPEADFMDTRGLPTLKIGARELKETYAALNSGQKPELIVIGCPHASLWEIIDVVKRVQGRKLEIPLWVCTSRLIKDSADRMGLTAALEEAGGKIVADTCMVVSPLERMGYAKTATDSGKAANYLPGFCRQQVSFHDIGALIDENSRP